MTLSLFLAHARFQYYRHGWPAALGLVLLAASIGVQTIAVPALSTQTAAVRATQEALRQPPQQGPSKQDTALAQQAALLASLPAEPNATSESVKTIYRMAAAHGVRLASGEYRVVREGSDRMQSYQITLPASASYPQLRAWLADVMNEIPALALDEISMRREDVGAGKIEARLRFTLFLKAP